MRVMVDQEGATIKIDGTIVGVSPLDERILAAGLHTVAIEKTGFVLFSTDVRVIQDELIEVNARLVPSAEFKRQYVEKAESTRLASYLTMGGGAAALIGGMVVFGVAFGAAATLRSDLDAYETAGATDSVEYERILAKRKDLGMMDTLNLVLGLAGIGALTVGVVIFFTGDDPGRFELSTGVAAGERPALELHFAVSPQGAAVIGSF